MNKTAPHHYDLVGDIHGELSALERLLARLGYRGADGRYARPAGRKLIFLGDFIDRGPDSRGVLHLVRRLVDEDFALAIMGNHEFNFVLSRSRGNDGQSLRPGKDAQIAETLASFAGREDEIPGWVEWMKALPFFLDLGDLRAVHAAWVPGDIAYLADKSLRDREFLIESARRGSQAWAAIERVLKGVELEMPDGIIFLDSNGTTRKHMRVRWWGDLAGLSWQEIAFPSVPGLPEGEARLNGLDVFPAYGSEEPPVFFGHYKLVDGYPLAPQTANVATLDYGLGHSGPATAYRWSGERVLDAANFVQVAAAGIASSVGSESEDARGEGRIGKQAMETPSDPLREGNRE